MTSKISVDFQNADPQGRVRLNTRGAYIDLEKLALNLSNGLILRLTDGELEVDGEAEYSEEEGIWVAKIDWHALDSAE